jgi:membrane protease YdiL (CAAX protease family)
MGLAFLVLFERGMPLAAAAAMVGVLLEEFIFRGVPLIFLLRTQDSPLTLWTIMVISSLTFTALHYSPLQIMYLDRFVFSCLALLVAVKFNSLWPPVLYHALANIVATASEAVLYNHAYAWVYIPLDVVLCAGVYLFCSRMSMGQVSQIGPVKVL